MVHLEHARTHLDMLIICCGICGEKKRKKVLKKISENDIAKIRQINGYENYGLLDDRYPKMICTADCSAVNDKIKYPDKPRYTFKLPSNVPRYHEIEFNNVLVGSMSDCTSNHTCFLCDQNKPGHPIKH